MPHKHRRDRSSTADSFELPPSSVAKPLPTSNLLKNDLKGNRAPTLVKISAKRKRSLRNEHDDTPRAFQRLMNGYRPPRAGLDDGHTDKVLSKKRRKLNAPHPHTPSTPTITTEQSTTPPSPPPSTKNLKPLPGEPASAFSARVNAALPIFALRKRQPKNLVPGLKERETKLEKRMRRMRAQWWEEEKALKEKREEEEEEMRERIEKMGGGMVVDDVIGMPGKKRKGKKGGGVEGAEEGDIWAQVGKKRQDAEGVPRSANVSDAQSQDIKGSGGLVGVHDVVSTPPRFSSGVKAKMKAAAAKANGRVAEGGLKKQVELEQARYRTIEGYRAMMKERGRQAIST